MHLVTATEGEGGGQGRVSGLSSGVVFVLNTSSHFGTIPACDGRTNTESQQKSYDEGGYLAVQDNRPVQGLQLVLLVH